MDFILQTFRKKACVGGHNFSDKVVQIILGIYLAYAIKSRAYLTDYNMAYPKNSLLDTRIFVSVSHLGYPLLILKMGRGLESYF
jgi:hypothetical protein